MTFDLSAFPKPARPTNVAGDPVSLICFNSPYHARESLSYSQITTSYILRETHSKHFKFSKKNIFRTPSRQRFATTTPRRPRCRVDRGRPRPLRLCSRNDLRRTGQSLKFGNIPRPLTFLWSFLPTRSETNVRWCKNTPQLPSDRRWRESDAEDLVLMSSLCWLCNSGKRSKINPSHFQSCALETFAFVLPEEETKRQEEERRSREQQRIRVTIPGMHTWWIVWIGRSIVTAKLDLLIGNGGLTEKKKGEAEQGAAANKGDHSGWGFLIFFSKQ